jgi:hypothetical protein
MPAAATPNQGRHAGHAATIKALRVDRQLEEATATGPGRCSPRSQVARAKAEHWPVALCTGGFEHGSPGMRIAEDGHDSGK